MDNELQNFLREYEFELPDRLIARRPAERREDSRLLLVDKKKGTFSRKRFADIVDLLCPEDLLVANAARVSPRRVRLTRRSGAVLEVLFLSDEGEKGWTCLIRGGGKLAMDELLLPLEKPEEGPAFQFRGRTPGGEGFYLLPVASPENDSPENDAPSLAWQTAEDAERFFEDRGEVPLPPYLRRPSEEADRERYQTVYARREEGLAASVAAPTAGLHFSREMLKRIQERGIPFAKLELSVGYGTFAPLQEENFRTGRLHEECCRIPESLVHFLNDGSRRIIAVGTTTLRALEANYREHNGVYRAGDFKTSLFLRPPDRVLSADGLLTNFHLPSSSLLLLVAAFAGRELILEAYRYAVKHEFRFFSYGDAMLIL